MSNKYTRFAIYLAELFFLRLFLLEFRREEFNFNKKFLFTLESKTHDLSSAKVIKKIKFDFETN